jgi:hypothetical protein
MIQIGSLVIEISPAADKKFRLKVGTRMFSVDSEVTPDDVLQLIRYLTTKINQEEKNHDS